MTFLVFNDCYLVFLLCSFKMIFGCFFHRKIVISQTESLRMYKNIKKDSQAECHWSRLRCLQEFLADCHKSLVFAFSSKEISLSVHILLSSYNIEIICLTYYPFLIRFKNTLRWKYFVNRTDHWFYASINWNEIAKGIPFNEGLFRKLLNYLTWVWTICKYWDCLIDFYLYSKT